MKSVVLHLSVTFLCLTGIVAPALAQQADNSGQATFVVLVRGARVGSENVTVSRQSNGWLISSSGRLDAPFDLVTSKFELNYALDWQPVQLAVQGVRRGQPFTLTTTFGLTTATSEVTQGTQRGATAQQVSPRTIVLPSNFFGAYEALAARLDGATPGTRLPVFVAPEGEGSITVDRVAPRRIVVPDGTIEVQDWSLSIGQPGGPIPLELWTDARHRLARIVLPTASIVVLRDDLANVMAREERIRNPGDESVFIPANGFSIAATITRPAQRSTLPGAVIFAAGPGPQGRDHVSYGIPIFGQLAGRLAEAGYFVVRYDPRGTGQTGGRTEAAALNEYAGDLRAIVAWLKKRKDVDQKRIAVIGYGEGAPVALTAASKDGDIRALGLLAAPAANGRALVMEQQEQVLSRMKISETEKSTRVALQGQVNDAVLTGRGWEGIPPEVRRQADTPWFKSWLQFDPAPLIAKLKLPILIVHGANDTEIAPRNADRLEEMARGRQKLPASATQKVIVPGVNHLLVSAATGSVDEYSTLPDRAVAAPISAATIDWLNTALSGR